MRTAYFWPVYGEHNEVCFPYFPSREAANVYAALGEDPISGSVLLTDGYAAYPSYAKKVGVTHAQCWSHARREIFETEAAAPDGAREGLRRIGALYDIEGQLRDQKLIGEAKRLHRLTHSQPHVEALFDCALGCSRRTDCPRKIHSSTHSITLADGGRDSRCS